jgi:hypothetical protein
MPSLDERWIIEIHVREISHPVEEMGDEQPGTVDAITGPAPCENRQVSHNLLLIHW